MEIKSRLCRDLDVSMKTLIQVNFSKSYNHNHVVGEKDVITNKRKAAPTVIYKVPDQQVLPNDGKIIFCIDQEPWEVEDQPTVDEYDPVCQSDPEPSLSSTCQDLLTTAWELTRASTDAQRLALVKDKLTEVVSILEGRSSQTDQLLSRFEILNNSEKTTNTGSGDFFMENHVDEERLDADSKATDPNRIHLTVDLESYLPLSTENSIVMASDVNKHVSFAYDGV